MDEEAPRPGTSRRGFLGLAGRMGMVAVGAIAGATVFQEAAQAYTYYCCGLAKPPGSCPGSGASFTCPSPYRKRTWQCCRSDGRVVFCGECTTGSSCYSGTFYCSEGWVSGLPCD